SAVAFFRTLGGASGVQVLGAALSAHIAVLTTTRLTDAGIPLEVLDTGEGELDVEALPGPAEEIVRSAYGDGMGLIFLIMGGMSIIALIAVSAMRTSLLRDTVDMDVQRVLDDDSQPPAPAERDADPGEEDPGSPDNGSTGDPARTDEFPDDDPGN